MASRLERSPSIRHGRNKRKPSAILLFKREGSAIVLYSAFATVIPHSIFNIYSIYTPKEPGGNMNEPIMSRSISVCGPAPPRCGRSLVSAL